MKINLKYIKESVYQTNRYEKVYLLVSVFISIYAVFYYCYRLTFTLSLSINEAWNLNHTLNYIRHSELYPDKSNLYTNNYPPISFMIYKFLSPLGVDLLTLGRSLSLLAVITIAFLIFLISKSLRPSSFSAIIASLWYLVNTFTTAPYYCAVNDPSYLALSLMAAGFYLITNEQKHAKTKIEYGVALQLLAGFTKHNLVTTPIISALYLSRNHNGMKSLIQFIIVSIIGLAIISIIFLYIFGQNFYIDIATYPREIKFFRGFQGWENLPWDVFIIAMIALKISPKGKELNFSIVTLLIAFFVFFIQKMGEGVARNASFELEFFAAVGLGYFINKIKIKNNSLYNISIIIIITRLLIAFSVSPLLKIIDPNFRKDLYERQEIVKHEVIIVKNLNGNVICSNALICVLAGKQNLLDGFYIQELISTGKITYNEVQNIILNQNMKNYTVDRRAEWSK